MTITPLNGHKDTVEKLLDRGANIEARDSNGRTPLMYAVLGGEAATLKALIDRGAVINIKDDFEMTAHLIGTQSPNYKIVTNILENQTSLKVTPFDLSITEFQDIANNKLLYFGKSELEAPNITEKEPFYRKVLSRPFGILLSFVPHQHHLYWASLCLKQYNTQLSYQTYCLNISRLIQIFDPTLTSDDSLKILKDLSMLGDKWDFSQRHSVVNFNGIIYSIEIGMIEGQFMVFTAHHQQ